MKDLFVPYEIAKQLKEKGFDKPCLGLYYNTDENPKINMVHQTKQQLGLIDSYSLGVCDKRQILTPMYQQVIDWFREKHEILIWIGYYPPDNAFRALLCEKYKTSMDTKIKFDIDYNTALNKIFQEALNLI
jgi:hypothetical protein